MNPMLEAALDHHGAYNWRLLPLIPRTKKPALKNWPEAASNDPEQIRAWWSESPEAGIGVLLGRATETIVLDVDGEQGAALVEKMKLPETLTASTSKGKHYFFRAPSVPIPIKKKIRIMPEVDLLGEGCFVVVEPSLHPSGFVYRFDNWGHVLAELPQNIIDLLDRPEPAPAVAEPKQKTDSIPSGSRNGTLTSWAGKMRRIGMHHSEILAALLEKNRSCDPPLPEAEVEAIVRSVGRYDPSKQELPSVLQVESAEALLQQTFDPIRWIAQPVLAEGLGLLVGAPKIGKSWLALSLSLAVATGRRFLGEFEIEQGRSLFLGLEDGRRRLQARINQLLEDGARQDLSLLEISTEIPKTQEGGLELIEGWLTAHSDARLCVVDTLARIRRAPRRSENGYLSDTEFLAPLQSMALKFNVCILLLHHDRKAGAEDPLDIISGTKGLSGAADQVLILKRESRSRAAAILQVTGRDLESQELALAHDEKMRWSFMGQASELQRTRERQEIVDFLSENAGAIFSVSAIAKAVSKNPKATSKLLSILSSEGVVLGGGYGKFYIPSN